MTALSTEQKIDAYLNRLRRSLRGLKTDEIREIIEELRSHVLDKASSNGAPTAAGVDAALAALGDPEELAAEYVTDAALLRAEISRSPASVLASLFRWASVSIAGFFVLLGSIVGYSVGVVLYLVGFFKLFHPKTAGLWMWHNSSGDIEISARMGFVGPPPGASDVLGWAIVPIGMLLGAGLVILTTRFALWCARQYRNSRALRQRQFGKAEPKP